MSKEMVTDSERSPTIDNTDKDAATVRRSHLSILLNPLINSIFNSPDPYNSPIRKLFNKITPDNCPKFILLVPPSYVLYNYKDTHSNSKLSDLCHYDISFLSSHIITLDSKYKSGNSLQSFYGNNDFKYDFQTLNNISITITFNKRYLYVNNDSGLGNTKFKILKVETLTNFNDYLPEPYYTMVYIDQPVLDPKRLIQNQIQSNRESKTSLFGSNPNSKTLLEQDISQHDRIKFEKLIHSNQNITEYFKTVFKQFVSDISENSDDSSNTSMESISRLFQNLVTDTTEYVGNETNSSLIKSELRKFIQEYIETNLYGTIWKELGNHLVTGNQTVSDSFYNLKYLSIDQLETDLYKTNFSKFKLSLIVKLEKNINKATNKFGNFKRTNTFLEKSTILIETLQILSEPIDGTPIDADTLLSLFVLLINKTQTKDLRYHILYLQNFYYSNDFTNSTKFGILGYSISTLEAVAFYLEDTNNSRFLQLEENYESKIKALLDFIQEENDPSSIENFDIKDYKEVLRYRTDKGESILSLCVCHHKNRLIEKLLTEFESVFVLEDLLDDETVEGNTLLLEAFKHGNHDAISIFLDLFILNCTAYELETYLNKQNSSKRTIGHHLSDESGLLRQIGKFIDWNIKDATGKTPLFTIFRSYDQINYSKMIKDALRAAEQSSYGFSYNAHTDQNGNTLLHIIKSDVLLLLESKFQIDINEKNKKGLTPLMIYIKYNRQENMKDILNDRRLNCLNQFDTKKFVSCYEYIRDPEILTMYTRHHINNGTMFKHCVCHSLRIYTNHTTEGTIQSCSLQVSILREDGKISHVSLNAKILKNILKLILKIHPMTFVPIESVLTEINKLLNSATDNWLINNLIPMIKLQNRAHLLHALTNCVDTLIELNYISERTFDTDESVTNWVKQWRATLANSPVIAKVKDVEPEGINAIKHFLKFNLQELTTLRRNMFTLEKLIIFRNLKNDDSRTSLDIANHVSHNIPIHRLRKYLRTFSDVSKIEIVNDCNDIGLNSTLLNISFYKKCINVLYKNIEYLLDHQILNWWKCYGELLEINRMLISIPQSVESNTSGHDSKRSDNSGIFGSFLEGQRAKNEQKLVRTSYEIASSMEKLGKDITSKHEGLAEELSKFMTFKESFLVKGFISPNVTDNIFNLTENYTWISKKYERYQDKYHKI
ncbi:hypothetical protein C6P45_002404 [Maudiozyma exigua]|uniref:VPS9 domain-containing protein n=1 Tax=Maudiozyma exigua TaxID=34358 RepID=A0A9P6VYV9_MAUEX|nr:hypothetical protein C6P45_002404 [Kazachstania exigua]